MGIIVSDASEMAGKRRREPQGVATSRAPLCLARAGFDNKIETIQRVLRQFLGEIGAAGLGKS
jgi:hypothetical protein